MPLVRVEVRNEYGLGLPELYKEANKEDPKAVLDGVAVAGLVGILRQLGDLAEFAAEVFHGLQEEVMNTSSRSHKLMLRARHIETALPPLEKAVLSQKSHLHFAYTTGSNWCARVKTEHHHFIYSDLPQFLMDSYEESRGPPRLHLLDKFDPGGPGSCLKRYSDPSFFRRASRSDETKAEKVLRYKKARKIKKKRSWKRKEEESNAARASFNGRTQFASRDCDGQTSPSQTVSTHGATLKSETGGRSNSFDSKTESGYIECVFHPTNSIEPEEHESKEPSPSRSNTDTHNDNLLLDYEIRSNLSPEEICQTSSCVTWDEKTEILHLSGQQSDNEDISDMSPPMNFVLVSQEREVVNAVDHESASTSVSFANQIDDVESELDQFMDALNTIESESETDIDFKTNQETEQGLNLVEDGTLSLSVEHSDQNQLVFEFQAEDNSGSSRISSPAADNQITIHPDTFLNKEMSEEIHNPDIVAERSLNFTSSLENEINVESVDGNVSFSGSVDDHSLAPVNNGNPVHEGLTNVRNLTPVQRGCFQDLNPEPSGHNGTTVPLAPMNDEIKRTPCEPTGPVKFWTNGGLLGLEPSKPPDFSPLNSMRQDSVANPTRQSNVASSEIKKGEYSDYIWKTSSRISPAKIEKPHFNHSQGQGMADQENDSKGSSRIFELGNRFLVNGLGQKTSCSEEPVIYQTKDMFGRKSSYTSPSSSPPLELMKLSFQPMERYETSKMKLKFPDESNGDTFRSFQLVPDPALPPRDIGSDSDDDDDTFCRSSPYMSDDCLSPSNSEQWESGESPNSNDFEIYDALRRISLTESVLNQFSENGVENHLHDLPSFDEEFINISEPNPVPPPLPPMEWRATKSILDTVAENQEAASETLNYALNVKLSGSTISQQPKPALLKRDGDIEPECTVKTKQPDWEKSNGLKEANQSASGKGMDEKEDFLHQIRTKSFNLRRTATARPPVTPNPTASAKVTAILEKANAIRQAVGSDDGEDEDTWSNT